MKKKNLAVISLVILAIALILMCINWFIRPFSDWIVRGAGLVLLLSLIVLVYTTVRLKREAK